MTVKALNPKKPLKNKSKNTDIKKKKDKMKNKLGAEKQKLSKAFGEADYTFLLLTIVLTVIGLIMLLSASTPAANIKFGKSYHFFQDNLYIQCLE